VASVFPWVVTTRVYLPKGDKYVILGQRLYIFLMLVEISPLVSKAFVLKTPQG
jgi:hypothetical protein